MSWLKIETHTPRKPEILMIARTLRVSRREAFAIVFETFAALDPLTHDGRLEHVRPAELDDLVGVPGIAEAMRAAGWLVDDGAGGLIVVNYSRHNGKSAKARAIDQARKQAEREART